MDLMYLSTLDLPGSLISESRTSASSSLQVSMDLPTCTHLVHRQCPRITQHVRNLYTDNPRITQHVRTLYTDNPRTPQKIGFCCNSKNFTVNPSCYLRRSPLQMYPQVFTRSFTQENRYTICTSVCIMSELCLLFISSCSLTLSLF
jgi:hypothetical protein